MDPNESNVSISTRYRNSSTFMSDTEKESGGGELDLLSSLILLLLSVFNKATSKTLHQIQIFFV